MFVCRMTTSDGWYWCWDVTVVFSLTWCAIAGYGSLCRGHQLPTPSSFCTMILCMLSEIHSVIGRLLLVSSCHQSILVSCHFCYLQQWICWMLFVECVQCIAVLRNFDLLTFLSHQFDVVGWVTEGHLACKNVASAIHQGSPLGKWHNLECFQIKAG